MDRSRCIAADGSLVTVEIDDGYDLDRPWFSYAEFRPRPGELSNDVLPFGVNTGPVSSVEVGAQSINAVLRSEVDFDGGVIAIYDGFDGGQPATLAAWRGSFNAAWGFHYRPEDTEAAIVEFFSRMRLADGELGLTVSVPQYDAAAVRAYKRVPDVGFLDVIPGSDAQQLVPRWEGDATNYGEVWRRDSLNSDWEDMVLMASASAVATMTPDVAVHSQRAVRNERAASFAVAVEELTWGD